MPELRPDSALEVEAAVVLLTLTANVAPACAPEVDVSVRKPVVDGWDAIAGSVVVLVDVICTVIVEVVVSATELVEAVESSMRLLEKYPAGTGCSVVAYDNGTVRYVGRYDAKIVGDIDDAIGCTVLVDETWTVEDNTDEAV